MRSWRYYLYGISLLYLGGVFFFIYIKDWNQFSIQVWSSLYNGCNNDMSFSFIIEYLLQTICLTGGLWVSEKIWSYILSSHWVNRLLSWLNNYFLVNQVSAVSVLLIFLIVVIVVLLVFSGIMACF